MMKKFLFVLILSLAVISTATAQPGRDVVWTQVGSALHAFIGAGSGVLGNYLYCYGAQYGFLPSALAFNLTTEQWEESTIAPFGVDSYGSATTDEAIYLIGWYDGIGLGSNVQKFTPIPGGPTGVWTQMTPYPVATCDPAAAWDGGNYIYAAGGFVALAGQAWYIEAYKYDIAANTWTQIASMPDSNGLCGGAFVNGKFYVVGGMRDAGHLLFEYNPGTNAWTVKTGPPVGVPCANYCTGFNDSLIFTAGGGGESYPASNEVQVYNPVGNVWTSESPLPEVISYNTARFVTPNKLISAGGYSASPPYWIPTTYRGAGFPTGPSTVSSHLTVTLVPFVQPIQIPASGGTFDFFAFVNNSATFSQEVDLWTKEIVPGGGSIGPILGPATVNMDTGTRGWYRHQNVPGTAVPGLYTYIAYVGDYPTGNIWATDSLQFTKLTTGDGPWVDNWSCSGEEIGNAENTLINHHSTLSTSVQPNPFNPTTVVSFELRDASYVSLRIYDTAGRLVETLVNGWRDAGDHQITFDGSGLPSGIYFAKLTAGDFSQVQKLVLLK
jgi:hypothetical protein